MEQLQHPDITAAERTGYPRHRQPRVFTTCDWCGSKIYEGDTYFDIHGLILCADCLIEGKREVNRNVYCDWCGTEIQDGDEYYEIHGEILCAECVNECRKEAGA